MSKLIDNMEIMEIFYNNPNKEYHIREIARLTKLSPSTVSKYLIKCTKEKLLDKREERKHLLFKANTENKIFKIKKINYNTERLFEFGLINYLDEEFNYPRAIILFGSFAKGEDIEQSDIDIFILSETKRELKLENYEKLLKKKIQLFVYNNKAFQEMKIKNQELLNNIINGLKLQGNLEVF